MDRDPSSLTGPMRRAMELAWESLAAGSFGIGAVAVDPDGVVLATGRNRIMEHDPGDDVIAGSSLAHAETNVVAKLPYRGFEGTGLELFTTLQPCLQCLGAVRLSSIGRVHVLAPDPLWRGIERITEHNEFLASNWPQIDEWPVGEWAVFSVLLPTYRAVAQGRPAPGWAERVPRLTALAEQLVASGEIEAAVRGGTDVVRVADALWDRLVQCRAEIEELSAIR